MCFLQSLQVRKSDITRSGLELKGAHRSTPSVKNTAAEPLEAQNTSRSIHVHAHCSRHWPQETIESLSVTQLASTGTHPVPQT